jgi:anti-sigma-K factor RskA
VHTLVGAYVLDAVDDDERALVEEHLDACAACMQEVTELRTLTAELAADAAAPPPPSLRSTVMARVANTRQLPPTVRVFPQPPPQAYPQPHPQARATPPARPPAPPAAPAPPAPAGTTRRAGRRTGRMSRPLMAVAAGLVAVSAGLGAVVVHQQNDLDAARQGSDVLQALASAAVDSPAAVPVEGGGRLAVVGVGDTPATAALVVTRDLHNLPTGRTYQLWLLGGPAPRSAGLVAGGGASVIVETSAADTGVAITDEPDGGSPQPTTTPLASAPLRT